MQDIQIKEETSQLLEKKFILKGLKCANCANKIEAKIGALQYVRKARLNFTTKKLIIEVNDKSQFEKVIDQSRRLADEVESGVRIIEEKGTKEDDIIFKDDNQELKKVGIRLAIGGFFFILALITKLPFWSELGLFALAYLIVGGDIVWKAVRNISRGQLFDENFLMTVATIGAFAIHEFPEAVAVMLFYQVGELFQDVAVNRSRHSITKLMDIKAEYANLETENGIKKVAPEEINIGDVIIIKPGEKVPLDGKVLDGESQVDTSALTGESLPRKVESGEDILSGFINKTGVLTVEVRKKFNESTVSRILDLVENASAKKASTEKFITKFAHYYTPGVVFGALALAIIPPLVMTDALFSEWIYRALIFLVISCPCALVVSIPLGFFGGIGGASKRGVLVKGGNYLEALNKVKTVVFDKTGTLTKGNFVVDKVVPAEGSSQKEVLELAAKAETHSNHPIAQSILDSYSGEVDLEDIDDYEEIAGRGIRVKVAGQEVLVGNDKLLSEADIDHETSKADGTIIHVVVDSEYVGYILIGDEIKEDAKSAIKRLKELGVEEIVMLTGDNEEVAKRVADYLDLDNYQAELLPDEKVEEVERLLSKNTDGKLVFVGDGINDAPVLARADIGVAMGGLGSDAAIEAADVVLMTDEPAKLGDAIEVANYTKKIVWQNIFFALGIKGIVLALGALGMATMWEAVFADVGVALLAVLNSMRVTRIEGSVD
jgi:Cd2+/Zn2+-exporting ATPase